MILDPPAHDEVKRKFPFGSSTMTGLIEERGRLPPMTVSEVVPTRKKHSVRTDDDVMGMAKRRDEL